MVIARVERIAMCCILGVHVIYCKEIKAKTGIIMSIDYEHIAVKSFRTNCDFSLGYIGYLSQVYRIHVKALKLVLILAVFVDGIFKSEVQTSRRELCSSRA